MAHDNEKVNIRQRESEQDDVVADNTLRIVDHEAARDTIVERAKSDENEIVEIESSEPFKVAKDIRRLFSDRF